MAKEQTVSIREFRENLSLYLRAVEVKKIHFVVLRHGVPVGRLIPEKKPKKTQKQFREELLKDIQESRAQFKRGEWYTVEEVEELHRRRYGLPLRKGQKKISIVFPKPPQRESGAK